MKRVLFISPQPFFQWRGSPIRVNFDLRALSDLGHEIDLLTLPIGTDQQISNVRIIRVANLFRAKDMSIGPSALKAAFDLILLLKGIRLGLKQEYDVIHGIEEGGFLAVLLSKFFRTQSVFEKHSDPFSYRGSILRNIVLSVYARVEEFTAKHADLVICTGPGLTEQAKALGGTCPIYDIFDIPSSLIESDPQKVAEIASQLKQSPEEVLITFVGSFAVYQGVDLMFEMIPHVVAKDKNARFIIIGGSESEIDERKSQLRLTKSDHAVTFLSKISPDKLPHYLTASDMFLVPRSAGVNTPLKILDYFKAGRAIVATDVPANQLILDETTALFAAPDPVSFANQVLRLLNDSELRQRLGENGLFKYKSKYDFAKFKELISQAYAELDKT